MQKRRFTEEFEAEAVRLARTSRRTARLMRQNGLAVRQKRRFKRTMHSEHSRPVAPNLLDQIFTAEAPNQNWGVDISYVWTREGWLCIWPSSSIFTHAASSAEPQATGCIVL